MIQITMSHRLDALVAALVSRLGGPSAFPLAAQEVIVPSAAMRRHLSLAMADSTGICANVRFSYLAQWFWEQIGKVLPVAKESPYAAEALVWRIFAFLGDAQAMAAHPRLDHWLKNHDAAGQYELAALLAGLFEQYLTYRPDWLSAWFSGKTLDLPPQAVKGGAWPREDEAWQAALWRGIEEKTGADGVHPADRFFEALKADGAAASRLPANLHVFCLPSIAPQYLSMLSRIGEWVQVELYVLNPCREFWFDVVPEKRLAALLQAGRQTYHETGNALLAAWGRPCQAHLSLLMEVNDDWRFLPDGDGDGSADLMVVPPSSLLCSLQDAILNLRELSLPPLREADRSLEVHVCHSLMREVEALHDQLLAIFASDEPPLPGEIVVVTPDVDRIAPLVDAVFGNAAFGIRIPYRIMGRKGSRMNPVARALMDVLALATSRLTAADVYDVLLQPLVSRRFGLEGELEQVHAWLEEAGICWGLDGEQKMALGLPPDDSRSFHDGFYRLFLAYALPQDEQRPFGSRLPAGNPEGSDAAALGSLWHFVGRLRALREALATPKAAKVWRDTVLGVLDGFVCREKAELEDDLAVRQAVSRLFDCMGVEGGPARVEADVMRRALKEALDASAHGTVPCGVVTFTSMAGLRNLPARFVCAIGLSDGVFPSESRPPEFDLMARAPRLGDTARRDSDRNVFLDLLLAARERLYLSYTGKSVRDNSEKLPSVVVSELLDAIVRARSPDGSKDGMDAAREEVFGRLALYHPLQAFSRRYFDGSADPRMRSAHSDYCRAQQERLAAGAFLPEAAGLSPREWDDEDEIAEPLDSRPFFTRPLAPPDEMWRDVSLEELVRFFMNPSRYLLQNRLGLAIPSYEELLPSDEPLAATGLDPHRLAGRILPLLLAGEDMDKIMDAAHAGLEFPSGAMGEMLVDDMLEELVGFVDRFSGEMNSPLLGPVTERLVFELDGENWSLFGSLGEVREKGLMACRYARMNSDGSARFMIRAWIRHLFLNAVAPPDVTAKTVCWFADGRKGFGAFPPDEAKLLLADLIRLYREGLCEPLRFFPVSAMAYVDGGEKMAKAYAKWETNYGGRPGEGSDDFTHLATRGMAEPLDDAFAACAKRVLSPMMAKMEKAGYDGSA